MKRLIVVALLGLTGCMAAPASDIVRTRQPVLVSGTGRVDAKGPFVLYAGERTFKVNHNGRSNFMVRLLRSDRSIETQLFNAIGNLQQERVYTVRTTGNYHVEVQADGAWTISIE